MIKIIVISIIIFIFNFFALLKNADSCYVVIYISNAINFINVLGSALLSIFISKHFYDNTNHNAFCTDILVPIKNLEDSEEIYDKITECKESFLYQYGKPTEINAIEELYAAALDHKNNSYEHAFEESIWNYFYDLYGLSRYQKVFIEEINDYIDLTNYSEGKINMKYYYDRFEHDSNYTDNLSNIEEELGEELYGFYIEIVRKLGSPDVEDNIIFKNKSINSIVYESTEYKLSKIANENYIKKKEIIDNLKLN